MCFFCGYGLNLSCGYLMVIELIMASPFEVSNAWTAWKTEKRALHDTLEYFLFQRVEPRGLKPQDDSNKSTKTPAKKNTQNQRTFNAFLIPFL